MLLVLVFTLSRIFSYPNDKSGNFDSVRIVSLFNLNPWFSKLLLQTCFKIFRSNDLVTRKRFVNLVESVRDNNGDVK